MIQLSGFFFTARSLHPSLNNRVKTPRTHAKLIFAVLFCLTFFSAPFRLQAQLPFDRSDRSFVQLLEQQQLFDVIAWDNEAKFNDPATSSAQRSTAAAQWLRARMLSALNQPQASQESIWNQVDQLAERLEAETRLFPRHHLVRFQASVTGLAQARLIRLQLKSQSNPQLRQRGLAAVRTSIMKLGLLQRELVDAAAGAVTRTVDDESAEFSRPQFQALGNDVDFQVLACLDVQSSLYPAEDEQSRIDSWRQILELTTTLQPKLPEESKLWWQAQTIALDAARRLKDWPEWKAKWDTAVLRYAPPEVLGDVAAAQLLHDLDRKQIDQAEKNAKNFIGLINLRTPESLNGINSLTDLSTATAWPEFDIARARLQLEKSQATTDTAKIQQAEAEILSFSDKMAEKHGRFWSAQLTTELLAGGTETRPTGSVSKLLVMEKITAGQWDQVEQLIGQGIEAAVAQNQVDQALELANLAAGSARANGPQIWMVEAIEAATLPFHENPRSDGIHFFACVLANLIEPSQLPDRQQVWIRHLQKWPTSENSNRIRVQLLAAGQVLDQELDAALEYLAPINEQSQWFSDAVQLMVAAFSDRIEQLYAESPDRAEAYAEDWSNRWKPRLQDNGDWLNRWTLAQKELGLLWVQSQLESNRPDYSQAEILLKRIAERDPELKPTSQSRWNALKARLNFQKNPATFSQTQNKNTLSDCSGADLTWLAKSIARQIPSSELTQTPLTGNQKGRANTSAQFFLSILEQLNGTGQPTSKLPFTLQMKLVDAHIQLNQFEDAKALATQLVQTSEKTAQSLPAQQLLGYCLAGSNDPTDAERSEKHWRRLTQRTQAGSDAWFEAKYYVAEALRRKGQDEDAYKLLAYLKLTQSEGWQNNRFHSSLNRLYQALAPN